MSDTKTGNCNVQVADCFNKNGIPQLGQNQYNSKPTLSELAFDNRYSTGGKRKQTKKKRKMKSTRKKGGGKGFYLDFDKKIAGMPTVKSYETCCPPLFNGKLLKGGKRKKIPIRTIKI